MGKDVVETGIAGLDWLLEGGIPRGSTVLITGPPGAGKTLMCLEYAFSQAKKGEKVLYVSTCEPIYKVNRFASSLSFYDLDLVSGGINLDYYGVKGYVEFQDYSLGQIIDEQYVGDFFEGIQKKVTRRSIDHLIIDSITSINMLVDSEIERRKRTLLFTAWVSRMGCTTLLTAESEAGLGGTERFLADAVFDLDRSGLDGIGALKGDAGISCRTVEILKMRGRRHMSGKYLYTISKDGVNVLTPTPGVPVSKDAAHTGIPDLDTVIGGMEYGSLWHFNADDTRRFEPFFESLMKEFIGSGDGVIYIASGREVNAKTEYGEGGIVVLAISGEDESDNKHIVDEVRARACQKGRRWRILFNMTGAADEMADEALKKLYLDLAGIAGACGSLLVTFVDAKPASHATRVVEPYANGAIEVWSAGSYVFLRVKKAPAARSYEPFVARVDKEGVRLLPL